MSAHGVTARIAGLALVALVAACAWSGSASYPSPPSGCQHALLVAARGSGESPTDQMGMGSTLYRLYGQLRAGGAVTGFGFPFADHVSGQDAVRDASARLAVLVRQRASRCPGERLLLAGFSMGAEIVGDALQSPGLDRLGDHPAAAVVLADPSFNPRDRVTATGTFDSEYAGSSSPRPLYPSALASRIRSYCRRGDDICQHGAPGAGKLEHGLYAPQQTCEAARFLATAAGLPTGSCVPGL
jgi:hypothetical protein